MKGQESQGEILNRTIFFIYFPPFLFHRGFGYVNFLLEKEAELAAQRLNGFQLWGMTIKTKGPHVLRSEGHLVESPPKVQMDAVDYRPFTDCAFFIQRLMCKNGKNVSSQL